jgi:hypothetical protein
MKYPDGQDVKLGDIVALGKDREGIVVCSIDTDEYSEDCPQSEWSYLKSGVLIKFPSYGLIHYEEPESALCLVARASGQHLTARSSAMNRSQNQMTSVEQALRIWPVLATRAIGATTPDEAKITYGDLAVAIGYQSRQAGHSLRRALGLIGWWCVNRNLPALNCLVVNQKTMECGESAVHTPRVTTQQDRANAVNFNWHPVQPPTAAELQASDRSKKPQLA